jgi:hypothetical protein
MTKVAFSVDEFCARNGICRATYYNLKKGGKGPRAMRVGSRDIISATAETAWHRRMEAEADASGAVEAARTEAADVHKSAASM